MKYYKEEIKLGSSDYTKEQMLSEKSSNAFGTSPEQFLKRIAEYERNGYIVKFETSILRKLFGIGLYKITAYK